VWSAFRGKPTQQVYTDILKQHNARKIQLIGESPATGPARLWRGKCRLGFSPALFFRIKKQHYLKKKLPKTKTKK